MPGMYLSICWSRICKLPSCCGFECFFHTCGVLLSADCFAVLGHGCHEDARQWVWIESTTPTFLNDPRARLIGIRHLYEGGMGGMGAC